MRGTKNFLRLHILVITLIVCYSNSVQGDGVAVPSDSLVCGADLAGRFSSVEFTGSQAHNVLVFLNRATTEYLTKISHISLLRALRVEEARAALMYRQCRSLGYSKCKRKSQLGFKTMQEMLLQVDGIGPRVLRSLRDQVDEVWCRRSGAGCCY